MSRGGPAEVSGIGQRGAGAHRVELGDKAASGRRETWIGIAVIGSRKSAGSHRQLIASGGSRQIEVAGRIHGHTVGIGGVTVARRLIARAAEQTRVEQVGAGGVQHTDKGRALLRVAGIEGAVKSRSRQHGVRGRRKAVDGIVGGAPVVGSSRDIGFSLRVDCHSNPYFAAWPDEGRIHQAAARIEFGQEGALGCRAVAFSVSAQDSANRLVRSRGRGKVRAVG